MKIEDWTHQYLDEIEEWRTYVRRYLFSNRVLEFIDIHMGDTITKSLYPSTPQIVISNTCGARIGGQTWYYKEDAEAYFELSSWLLEEKKEVKRVLRHELGHYIKEYCGIKGIPHGKEYYNILKLITGDGWKEDRHWHTTKAIERARLKIHPTSHAIKIR